MSQTDFPLLEQIISNGLLTIEQLEYFLSSGSSTSESVRINHAFMTKLIELEQEDPRLAQDNVIVELNGPVTQFIQKLLEVLFNNTYILSKDSACPVPSFNLLFLMITLPDQFIARSNISTVCIASLFARLEDASRRIDFMESAQSLLQNEFTEDEQIRLLDQMIANCNQYISVTLSLYDKPRKPASAFDLLQIKSEFLPVLQLLQLIRYMLGRFRGPRFQKLAEDVQNEYVNSNAYNITPDTDYWLQKHPYPLNLDVLPTPVQMMIRMRSHERQFPPQMFSLLDYPFILNSGTKAQIFRYEVTHNVPHIGKLTVSRARIVDDTMSYLTSHSANWMADDQKALLRIPLKVVFDGEEGIDAGGLSNEFFQLILAQLFDKKYNMFSYHENERVYWF